MTAYTKERVGQSAQNYPALHGGDGVISVQRFGCPQATLPAYLLHYRIPPGASEGAHRHDHDEPDEGAFDEFYLILAGNGVMTINGEEVSVSAGDHVHVALGATRAIANRSDKMLDVYLVAIRR